jgi:CubicO group peptidase (beta-lactamase class C family)
VVHDGRVIAERYAGGVGIDTPLPSFSMTKFMVNALIGILTQQGLVSPSMPAPIPEWRGAGDPRREIEVEHLMRMTTGLDLDESYSGFGGMDRMYLAADMSATAVNAKMIAPPGQRWNYFERDDADPGAHRARRRRRRRADAGVRVARAVQSARHAKRDAGVR